MFKSCFHFQKLMEPLNHLINAVPPDYSWDLSEQSPAFFSLHHLQSMWAAADYSIQPGIWPTWTDNLLYTAFPKVASAFLVKIVVFVPHSNSKENDDKSLI